MYEGIYEAVRRNKSIRPEELAEAISKALDGLNPVAVVIVGSVARGEFVRGLSDVDLVVIVNGELPFRGRVVGSVIGDVEVVVFTVDEFCRYWRYNGLMMEAVNQGINVMGNLRELLSNCSI